VPNKRLDYERARKLLDKHGGEADDFFKLWPEDKIFFFSSDNNAFVAFAIKRKVAICMGDPVGPDGSISLLLNEFKQYCREHKLIIAFIQTTDKYRKDYQSIGLGSILIGADAVIGLEHFGTITIHNKYFRNLVNRYEKQEFSVSTSSPPHDKELVNELKKVSDSWIKLPNRKEWSFLTGRFDDDYLHRVKLYILRDKTGKAQAFVNELPTFKDGVATVDLMRHRSDAPANSIDMLFINLLTIKQSEGYSDFNLGMSPLDGKPFVTSLPGNLLIHVYRISDSFIGFKGLHQFKAKYEPDWEPVYVWYQGNPRYLLSIGLAVYGLMK
jgi:phosphatidylglycerol lysyltransferase